MQRMRAGVLGLTVAAVACSGAGGPDGNGGEATAASGADLIVVVAPPGGTQMNGVSLNGTRIGGGLSLIGDANLPAAIHYVQLGRASVAIPRSPQDHTGGTIGLSRPATVTLAGGVLTATYENGPTTVRLTGADFAGVTMQAIGPKLGVGVIPPRFDGRLGSYVALRREHTASNDLQAYAVRVFSAAAVSDQPDLVHYRVDIQTAPGTWSTLCPGEAIAVPDRFRYDEAVPGGGARIADPDAFTFACLGSAIAKCVDTLGYAPWRSVSLHDGTPASLAPYFEACTRVIRADYCGNGLSLTRNGTLIDVADDLGLQRAAHPEWPVEARWLPGGAECAETTRQVRVPGPNGETLDVRAYVAATCPAVFGTVAADACGALPVGVSTGDGRITTAIPALIP